MSRIEAVREWIDVQVNNHLLRVELGDETSEEGAYTIHLEPTGALELAQKLLDGVEELLEQYPNTNKGAGDIAQDAIAAYFARKYFEPQGLDAGVDDDEDPDGD